MGYPTLSLTPTLTLTRCGWGSVRVLLHADGSRSHFERYRCDVYLDDEPSVPAPPRREWAQVVDGGGAVGAQQPHPYPGRTLAVPQPYTLRIDGPCWLRAVPNARP